MGGIQQPTKTHVHLSYTQNNPSRQQHSVNNKQQTKMYLRSDTGRYI